MGLTKERWDTFSVNLSGEPATFFQCKKMIEQTANSKYYYFKPELLHIKIPKDKNDKNNKNRESLLAPESDPEDADSKDMSESNLMVTLKGLFLIRK